eukprot:147600-Pleurochrysis_carterae.AAC.1
MVSAPAVDSSLHRTLTEARAPRSVSEKVGHPEACCVYKCAVGRARLQGAFDAAGGVAGSGLYAFQFKRLLASRGHEWELSFITHSALRAYAAPVEPCDGVASPYEYPNVLFVVESESLDRTCCRNLDLERPPLA